VTTDQTPSTEDTEPTEYRQYRFAPPPGACEILLVRHGESAAVVPGVEIPLVDGHDDPALSADGRAQAQLLAARLAHERVDAIYVSSLRRTQETAAPTAAAHGLTPTIEHDLREVFLGEWEGGLFRKRVSENDPIAEAMFREGRWDVIPGAESHEQLAARLVPVIERIASTHPDQRVMVVVHGGVIGSLLAHASGGRPFAFVGADNASISHLVILGDRWIVRRFNDTGHLDGELSAQAEALT
jgi:probable phosphoglycerate mutase